MLCRAAPYKYTSELKAILNVNHDCSAILHSPSIVLVLVLLVCIPSPAITSILVTSCSMPFFSLSRFRQNFLLCPVRHAPTLAYLLFSMCFQNSPQQAQGVVGYRQFPFLNQFDSDVAAAIVAFCDAALHFAQTNVEVHKVTHVIDGCLSPAAKYGLNIYCRGRSLTLKCSYPEGMVFTFDDATPTIWEAVRDYKIQWWKHLSSAVTVDTYEAVLKAASLIPLAQ